MKTRHGHVPKMQAEADRKPLSRGAVGELAARVNAFLRRRGLESPLTVWNRHRRRAAH